MNYESAVVKRKFPGDYQRLIKTHGRRVAESVAVTNALLDKHVIPRRRGGIANYHRIPETFWDAIGRNSGFFEFLDAVYFIFTEG